MDHDPDFSRLCALRHAEHAARDIEAFRDAPTPAEAWAIADGVVAVMERGAARLMEAV